MKNAEVLEGLLRERQSCRAFLDEDIPRDVMEKLLTMAQLTPSWCNTQPWQVYLVEGAALHSLRDGLLRYVETAAEEPDLAFPEKYEGIYQERRRECAWQLYDAVGVAKGDRVASRKQSLENIRFFGAPALALITSEEALGVYGAIDCGLYIGNFLLAAQSLGLATIAQAALAAHSPFFRDRFDIPNNRTIIAGISFGKPQPDHPANGFRTTRADVANVMTRLR